METVYYLAIDIGASSGRHILSWLENGKINTLEIHRFKNEFSNIDGHLCWDTERLFREIVKGIKRCLEVGMIPKTVGIDTWGVDYVLLNKNGQVVGNTYAYRDSRTEGMDQIVHQVIAPDELYRRTGIQKQNFNTIFQLMASKTKEPEILQEAETLLMIPDYFNYRLTGKMGTEYTNASTTQLISIETKQWDKDLIRQLGYKESLFTEIYQPGSVVGTASKDITDEVGYEFEVIRVASHDTASAVVAVPAQEENFVYISSGTWSLMGIDSKTAVNSEESRIANFTNEGGCEGKIRFLKNIMGLWMIQSIRKEFGDEYSYEELCEMAENNKDFKSVVDVNNHIFLAPESMKEAIREYCSNTKQPVPEEVSDFAVLVYQSLGHAYKDAMEQLESITGNKYDSVYIVGGGSDAEFLNKLTVNSLSRKVYAGPKEATAIGNIIIQLIHDGCFASIKDARICVAKSFPIKNYS